MRYLLNFMRLFCGPEGEGTSFKYLSFLRLIRLLRGSFSIFSVRNRAQRSVLSKMKKSSSTKKTIPIMDFKPLFIYLFIYFFLKGNVSRISSYYFRYSNQFAIMSILRRSWMVRSLTLNSLGKKVKIKAQLRVMNKAFVWIKILTESER